MIEKNQDQERKKQEIQLNRSIENKESLQNKYKELNQSHVQDRQLSPSRGPLSSEKQEMDTDKSKFASQASIQTKNLKQMPSWLMPAKTLRVHSQDMTTSLRRENTHSKMPTNMSQTHRAEHTNVGQTHQTEVRSGLDQKIIMGLFAIIWAGSKFLHNRPISFFSGCVHFATQRPGVESA